MTSKNKEMTKKIYQNLNSIKKWDKNADSYAREMKSQYHKGRIQALIQLFPDSLLTKNKMIFDFGCGDGYFSKYFLMNNANVSGCDTSERMVSIAKKRLKEFGKALKLLEVGSAECLNRCKSNTFDGIIAFNVLAYLTKKQEKIFYVAAKKTLKKGGYLIITHSNNLFDLFTLNKMTVKFFQEYLIPDKKISNRLRSLLRYPDEPKGYAGYNIRENALSYPNKLAKFGFKTKKIIYFNRHVAPPILKDQSGFQSFRVKLEDEWKLNFICSTFGVTAQKI